MAPVSNKLTFTTDKPREVILVNEKVITDAAIKKIGYHRIFTSTINCDFLYKQIMNQYDNSYTMQDEILDLLQNSMSEYSETLTVRKSAAKDENRVYIMRQINKLFMESFINTNTWVFMPLKLERPIDPSLPTLSDNDIEYDRIYGKRIAKPEESKKETFTSKEEVQKAIHKLMDEPDIDIKKINEERIKFGVEDWRDIDIDESRTLALSYGTELERIRKKNGGKINSSQRIPTTHRPHHIGMTTGDLLKDSYVDNNLRRQNMKPYRVAAEKKKNIYSLEDRDFNHLVDGLELDLS